MDIKTYTQGEDAKKDKEMFGQLGAWLTSKEVADELGGNIISATGDVWHVASDNGDVVAFAETRILKNKKAHVRFIYGGNQKTRAGLVRAVVSMAKEKDLDMVYTYDKDVMATMWAGAGFEAKDKRPNSSFRLFEKMLKEKGE